MNATAQFCHLLEPQARLCSEQQKVAQMTGDVYGVDLVGRIVWVQQHGLCLASGGKAGARRGCEAQPLATEQVRSKNPAQKKPWEFPFNSKLCQIALGTSRWGGADTGARCTFPIGWHNPGAR